MNFLASGTTIDLGPQGQFTNLRNVEPSSIVEALVTFVLIIAALAFFFWLVLGGIKWITSGGDKAQTETARNQITAALVGLVIVFSAWALIQIIGTFFGVDLLNVTIPNVSFIGEGGGTTTCQDPEVWCPSLGICTTPEICEAGIN